MNTMRKIKSLLVLLRRKLGRKNRRVGWGPYSWTPGPEHKLQNTLARY